MKKFRKFVPHVVTKTWCGLEDSRGVLACAVSLEMALRDAAGLYPLLRRGLPIIVIDFQMIKLALSNRWVGHFSVIYIFKYVFMIPNIYNNFIIIYISLVFKFGG